MKTSIFLIPISLLLIAVSNYLGHVNPPTSILLTPILIPVVTLISLKASDLGVTGKMFVIITFIGLNDFLIRTYAGGTHDSAGNGWVILMFLIGCIISLGIVIVYVLKLDIELKKSLPSLLIAIIILLGYYVTCRTYGMSWIESPSLSIASSKKSGKYLGQLDVQDNFKTDEAWYEQTVRINHQLPIKSRETMDQITYVVEANSDELTRERRYIIHGGMTGYNWLNKRITFRTDKDINEVDMVITEAENIKIVLDSVKIKRP